MSYNQGENKMKKVSIKKLNLVSVPEKDQEGGAVAFQLVEFTINFFGSIDTFRLDTKITKDGQQTVIGGNGWIPHGYIINI